jgi:tRNA pseudouridine32 synthase/23S rRNA pseudouridine746 synthase
MDILYQDQALLVINKPAGLSTLPDGYNPSLPHVKKLLEEKLGRLWIVHRLDKDTSGVLLLARTAEAHRALNTQFEKHLVSKLYHALIVGNPAWQEKTVSLPLCLNGDRQHRTVVDLQEGKPAITHLKVLERFSLHCLMQAIPETGRTHQIRAHLSAMGLSILGDKLYGSRINTKAGEIIHPFPQGGEISKMLAGSMALHAKTLEVNHPLSGERLKLTAPYPDAFIIVLQKLRFSNFDKRIEFWSI